MKPGRDLDQLIGEKVFSYKIEDLKIGFGRPDKHIVNPDGSYTLLPTYSTHIKAAWEILEKFDSFEIRKRPSQSGVSIFVALSDCGLNNSCYHSLKVQNWPVFSVLRN